MKVDFDLAMGVCGGVGVKGKLKYETALFQCSLFLSQSVQICIPRFHSYDIHRTIKKFLFCFLICIVLQRKQNERDVKRMWKTFQKTGIELEHTEIRKMSRELDRKTLIELEDEEIQKASSSFSDCLMLLKCRMIDSPEPSVGLMLLKCRMVDSP